MLHLFVETKVFGFAAPAHHKKPAAVELLERARRGELRLHLPSVCLTEVRYPVRTNCQPRVTPEDYQITDRLLNRFDASVKSELARLPQILGALRTEPNLDVFALNEPKQPWDKDFKRTPPLADLYDQARVWVYGDFELTKPVRPPGWPLNPTPGQQPI
jgi:hypothetical protein